MALLITGLIVFIGVHSVSIVAPDLRDRAVARIGAAVWRSGYSIVSAAGLVMLVVGYGLARGTTPVLYVPPAAFRYATIVLMVFVFPMLLSTYLPGRIQRTLKHPMLTAVKTWALAHLLANGSLADVALFGTFLLWAGAVRMSVKRHPRQELRRLPERPWNDAVALAAGLAIYALFVFGGHRWLIGIPVLL